MSIKYNKYEYLLILYINFIIIITYIKIFIDFKNQYNIFIYLINK